MGLLLHHPTSFNSLTSGTSPGLSPGGPTTPESDLDLDSEPSDYCNLHPQLQSPHRHSRCRRGLSSNSNRNCLRSQQHRKPGHRTSNLGRQRPAAAETHHVKPHNHWAADADEGRALARSNILLPGEQYAQQLDQQYGHERHRRSSRASSDSSSSDGRQRRPPSLERQDAFRDEKTIKRRRCSWDDTSSGLSTNVPRSVRTEDDDDAREVAELYRMGLLYDDDAREVAELYRMGLLYDDEHERGEGFSLDRIVREEPVYSLRVRPARRRGREDIFGFVPSFTVDLAFPAFAEDESLARWLISGCSSSQGMLPEEPRRPRRKALHDTPRLTVIYELADDAMSVLPADDFLEFYSVSNFSGCVAGEEVGQDWAILDKYDGNETALSATAAATMAVADDEDEEVDDPWVVLGHDGS
ncbi:hypothetical protein N657DRAFT_685130 [Parathielavia appendiculata]|uniref:Uncharacterized protein n=1 Tax=Parathielavia appendiculata TaxID=2587402 RepID=A0AAN6YYQ0_9PEZI|nr:hypothetical protein N657DRAFT_685130 [Parathielavia appendiculata]